MLRQVNARERYLRCHTHRDSGKVTHLLEDPVAEWLFYDSDAHLQCRVRGPTTVSFDDALADELWAEAHAGTRLAYDVSNPGGPLGESRATARPRDNFAAIETRIEQLDILDLGGRTLRRACFRWTGEVFEGQWINP